MEKEEILKKISDEKDKLFDENNYVDEKVEFFKKFKSSFDFNAVEKMMNMDIFDFMIVYMSLHSKKCSFQEISTVVNQCRDAFETDGFKFLFFISQMDDIFDELELDDNQNLDNQNLLNLMQKHKNSKKSMKFINNIKNTKKIDVELFMKFYFEDRNVSLEMMALIASVLSTKKIYNSYQSKIDQFEIQFQCKSSRKEKEKLLSQIASIHININELREEFIEVERQMNTIISAEKNKKRKARKELNSYMYIETWLKLKNNEKEISSIPKEITQIKNKSLIHSILEYVYDHNMNEYTQLKEKYDHLLLNSYNQYRLLFDRYNINIAEYNVDITKDIKEVESILTILNYLGIQSVEDIISIVNHSRIEIVENIQELVQKGYISHQFVQNQLGIFNSNYLNLVSNIELYQSEKLSISNIHSMESTLDKDSILIKKNIQILKDYQLFTKISQAQSKDFMLEENLKEKIDRILELGLETYLQEDLGLLSQDLNSFKRIIVLKRLNIPIEDISQLYSILENQKFVIPDHDIDNYIFDANQYEIIQTEEHPISKNDFYQLLEQYQNTKLTYNIDGVFISKNKVQRNLDNITGNTLTSEEQLNAILSDTILEKEEVKKIKKCLFSTQKVKK